MKLKKIKIGKSYQLKTPEKARKALKEINFLDSVDVEKVINNTYTDEYCSFFAEGQIVKVDYIDSGDYRFNIRIENEDEKISIWTNAHCLKKIK